MLGSGRGDPLPSGYLGRWPAARLTWLSSTTVVPFTAGGLMGVVANTTQGVEKGACRMRGCRYSLLTRQTEGAADHDGDKRTVLCSAPTCVAGGVGSPGPLLSALGRHARSRL